MPNSKRKGSTNERELCKILTESFNKPFIRTAGSGSFLGGKNVSRLDDMTSHQAKARLSDIQPPDDMNIVIECKSRSKKNFDWHRLLSDYPEMDSWIEQVRADAMDMLYILCFKIDYTGWSVCVETKYDFVHDNHIIYKDHTISLLHPFLEKNLDKLIELSSTT